MVCSLTGGERGVWNTWNQRRQSKLLFQVFYRLETVVFPDDKIYLRLDEEVFSFLL